MKPIQRRRFAITACAFALGATLAPAFAQVPSLPMSNGRVFTATNSPAGNELLVLGRTVDGGLALLDRMPTAGLGTGGGLGSQGAVTLSGDGRHLFVVNAASHTVSTFTLAGQELTLSSVVDSGGLSPISVAEREGLVYVLNAGGSGNVAGFRQMHGRLQPLLDGVRGLSAAGGTAPAQVGFSSDGDVLVVTEKATNRLVTFVVRQGGTLGPATVTPSAGLTPFGFAFDNRDHLIVSEAVGGASNASSASSYRFGERSGALPSVVSAAVPTLQTAACWVAVTPNGRYAYTGNAGSDSVSSYRVGRDGSIVLAEAAAGSTGAGHGITDLAVARSGQLLFALAPRGRQVVAFELSHDGRLAPVAVAAELPAALVGLAAN